MRHSESDTASDPDPFSTARILLLVAVLATAASMAGVVTAHSAESAPSVDGDTVRLDQSGQENDTAAAQQDESDPVSLSVEGVTNCGSRCRVVTANLTNVGNETLENVTAETQISAGDREVWSRTTPFGNVSANESTNRTARIRLSFGEAFAVASNDGRVTIKTTVRWDGGNATFTERRRVMG